MTRKIIHEITALMQNEELLLGACGDLSQDAVTPWNRSVIIQGPHKGRERGEQAAERAMVARFAMQKGEAQCLL